MELVLRLANLVVVGIVTYALAYFGLAHRGATVHVAGHWASWPDYRGVPEDLFTPMHYLDRVYWRPNFWEGTIPAAERLGISKAAAEAALKNIGAAQ